MRREAPPPARYNAQVDTQGSGEPSSESSIEPSGESSGWLCSESALSRAPRSIRLHSYVHSGAYGGFPDHGAPHAELVFLSKRDPCPSFELRYLSARRGRRISSVQHPRHAGIARCCMAYGVAMALTFDEFGMWLHLGGSYWQRASVDAIIVVAAVLGLDCVRVRNAPFRVAPHKSVDRIADRPDCIRRGAVRHVGTNRQIGGTSVGGA